MKLISTETTTTTMTDDDHDEFPKKIQSWNSQTMDYPDTLCLHDLFTTAAKKTPNDIAIVYRDQKWTFSDLDRLTDDLARVLYDQYHVRPDSIVGILMEHCTEFVISYIAILKAGGAYMPLEIAYPPELLSSVMKESTPAVVLTKAAFASRLPNDQPRMELNGGWSYDTTTIPSLNNIYGTSQQHKPHPDNLAFVVMSSGTTGTPKGICVPHRAAVHSYYFRLKEHPYDTTRDREACHVFFVWELLRPLLGNVPLYIIPDEVIYDPPALVSFVTEHAITRMLVTPSLLQLVLDTIDEPLPTHNGQNNAIPNLLPHMRILYLCGEVVTIALRDRFLSRVPHCRLLNLYSVSECHDVSECDLTTEVNTIWSPKYAPCGKVIPNVKAYVLSDDAVDHRDIQSDKGDLAPLGVPGELFVGGPVLARGYLNRPEQTARRFVVKKIDGVDNVRLYRTGDHARFLPNGHLELIGRCDFTVKIRGYTVALGAVEAALTKHCGVKGAAVMPEGDEGEDKRFVAYLVLNENDDNKCKSVLTAMSLREFLKDHLPHYAIPQIFAVLPVLPVNSASGKLDRKKLPPSNKAVLLPAGSLQNSTSEELDLNTNITTGTQKSLASIWAELLSFEDVNFVRRDMNFFDAGGHSLLAARLATKIQSTFQIESFLVGDIIDFPNLEQMAERIDILKQPPDGTLMTTTMNKQPTIDFWRAEVHLDDCICPIKQNESDQGQHNEVTDSHQIFITGATGFLGAHIVSTLLQRTKATIICLVRANDISHGHQRLLQSLAQFKLPPLNDDDASNRLVPIVGDLSAPLLGLPSKDAFMALARRVTLIIHNGAWVNLVSSYGALKPTNVGGTQEVLRLATAARSSTIPVHYISTNGVFPITWEGTRMEHVVDDPTGLIDGYGQSKWVAEGLILKARERGCPVSILRPGNMTPSGVTACWNPSDFIRLLFAGCKAINAVPLSSSGDGVELQRWYFDMTPVDFAAEAIVSCVVTHPESCLGGILHIQNPRGALGGKQVFDNMVLSCGRDNNNSMTTATVMERLPLSEWKNRLMMAVTKEEDSTGLLHQLEAGLERFINYFEVEDRFDTTNLEKVMTDHDLSMPCVDSNYVTRIFATA